MEVLFTKNLLFRFPFVQAEHHPVSKVRSSDSSSSSSSSSSESETRSAVKKAEGPFFRSASGGTTRQLGGRVAQLQQQKSNSKLQTNLSPQEREDMKRDETIVLVSLIVILVSITLILLTSVVYIVRRHELLRRKILHLLGRLDMSEPADDYKVSIIKIIDLTTTTTTTITTMTTINTTTAIATTTKLIWPFGKPQTYLFILKNRRTLLSKGILRSYFSVFLFYSVLCSSSYSSLLLTKSISVWW